MPCHSQANPTEETSDKTSFERLPSHQSAVLLRAGIVLGLKAQPKYETRSSQGNHSPIRSVADGQQYSLKGPFDELGHRVDDVLCVHGVGLHLKNTQGPEK